MIICSQIGNTVYPQSLFQRPGEVFHYILWDGIKYYIMCYQLCYQLNDSSASQMHTYHMISNTN